MRLLRVVWKWVKVCTFVCLLPEYMFRPYQCAKVTVLAKDRTAVCYLKVVLEGREDEPEVSQAVWKKVRAGDDVYVIYRTSWVHDDVQKGRRLSASYAFIDKPDIAQWNKVVRGMYFLLFGLLGLLCVVVYLRSGVAGLVGLEYAALWLYACYLFIVKLIYPLQ